MRESKLGIAILKGWKKSESQREKLKLKLYISRLRIETFVSLLLPILSTAVVS